MQGELYFGALGEECSPMVANSLFTDQSTGFGSTFVGMDACTKLVSDAIGDLGLDDAPRRESFRIFRGVPRRDLPDQMVQRRFRADRIRG